MTLPTITLVMPSFNQAAFLEEALESVLAQDYPELEFVVVDGGSTDGSVDLIRGYESRLAWWTSGPDAGQAAALNAAFARARGELLGWLNSDDVLLPGALRQVAEALAGSDAMLAYGNNALIDERSVELADLPAGELDPATMVRTWQNPVPQPGSLVRRSTFERFGPLDETLHYYFDFAFLLRVALGGGGAVRVQRNVAAYRLHGQSKSMAAPLMKAEEHLRLSAAVLRRPDLPASVVAVARESDALSHLTAAQYFHVVLDPRARAEARTALRLAPQSLRRQAAALVARTLLPHAVTRVLRALRTRRTGRRRLSRYA